jgi:hypothetical protein
MYCAAPNIDTAVSCMVICWVWVASICTDRVTCSVVRLLLLPCVTLPAAVADLASNTTEDTEEGEWLEQQRQAQKLHEFYSARAAQGELLRGSLASSLRSSTSSLWAATGSSTGQLGHLQQGSGGSMPTSAPGMMRANKSTASKPGGSVIGDRRSPRRGAAPASNRAGCATHRPLSSSSSRSRPGSPSPRPAGSPTCPRTPSPGRCRSPACDAARPSSRPSSAAGSSRCRTVGSPHCTGHAAGAGGSRPQSPWAPAVVEYRQQAIGIDKPWQVANQLLVAAADEEVVQELAGASSAHRLYCAGCTLSITTGACGQHVACRCM